MNLDVISLMGRVLGLDHPDTLSYASKFTTALARQNKAEEARALAKHLEEAANAKLGSESASTRSSARLMTDLERAAK